MKDEEKPQSQTQKARGEKEPGILPYELQHDQNITRLDRGSCGERAFDPDRYLESGFKKDYWLAPLRIDRLPRAAYD